MSSINVAGVLKLADKTSGRDKLCRVVQYGSKFVYWLLEQEGLGPQLVKKLRDLESSISTARKLFRLGKSIDSLRSALQTIHLVDPVLRLLVTLARINRGIFLLFDHVIWAGRMRLLSLHMDYWNKHANRFWLLAIALGLLRDLYEVLLAVKVEKERLKQHSSGEQAQQQQQGGRRRSRRGRVLASVVQNNPALMVDVVKNGADLLIPVSRLDIVYLPSGVVGLLGVVSSLAGLVATYNDHYKLKFS